MFRPFTMIEAVGDPPPVPSVPRSRVALAGIVGLTVVAGMFFAGWTPKARQDQVLHTDAEKIRTALPRVQTTLPKQSPAETTARSSLEMSQAIEETTIYPRTTGYVKRVARRPGGSCPGRAASGGDQHP